jgi:predicted HicB family RNase H-like nuclease
MNQPQETRTQVRFPSDIHRWLTERARQNDRSMNAELVRILRETKEQEVTEQKSSEGA